MGWICCSDVDEFIDKRGAALTANESLYNLTWAAIHRSRETGPGTRGYTFLTFDEDPSSTAHAFIQNKTQHLVLSSMSASQVTELLDFLNSQDIPLKEIEGPRAIALTAVHRWTEQPGRSYTHKMKQGVYELTRVNMPDLDDGKMVMAGPQHKGLLQSFITGFWRDCFPKETVTTEQILARVDRFINEQRAYLWCTQDGEVVSMAAVVRESPNATSISAVFTPRHHRGKGHAARIVATLSQAQLDKGKSACNLHTDLTNPTSNGVYIRIGYTQIGEGMRFRLFTADISK